LVHKGQLVVHTLSPEGRDAVQRLGMDLAAGERPVFVVPAGYPQAAEIPEGVPFAFGTNVCAPPFSFDEREIAQRDPLIREFPWHCELIERLTRTV
jgi:predicted cupin superfamily sugar epimerase